MIGRTDRLSVKPQQQVAALVCFRKEHSHTPLIYDPPTLAFAWWASQEPIFFTTKNGQDRASQYIALFQAIIALTRTILHSKYAIYSVK